VWPVAVLLCWQALPSAPWVQGANWQIEPLYPLMLAQAQLPVYPEMAPPFWHGEPPTVVHLANAQLPPAKSSVLPSLCPLLLQSQPQADRSLVSVNPPVGVALC
jgi:hypothetical protein